MTDYNYRLYPTDYLQHQDKKWKFHYALGSTGKAEFYMKK